MTRRRFRMIIMSVLMLAAVLIMGKNNVASADEYDIEEGDIVIHAYADGTQTVSQDGADPVEDANPVLYGDSYNDWYKVTIISDEDAEAYVTFRDLVIEAGYATFYEYGTMSPAVSVSGAGTTTIEMDMNNIFSMQQQSEWCYPAIEKLDDGKLIFTDYDQNGSITAKGGFGSAAIGGAPGQGAKNITVDSGAVIAVGGYGAAGIGSGVLTEDDTDVVVSGIVVSGNAKVCVAPGYCYEDASLPAAIGYGTDYEEKNAKRGKKVTPTTKNLYDVGYVRTYENNGDDWLAGMIMFDYYEDIDFEEEICGTVTTYGLWVGGTLVTSKNAANIKASIPANNDKRDDKVVYSGKASYDPDTKTLTLTNYQYEGPGHYFHGDSAASCIHYEGKGNTQETLTIVVNGENSVTQAKNAISTYGITTRSWVYTDSDNISDPEPARIDVVIKGTGSLDVTAGFADTQEFMQYWRGYAYGYGYEYEDAYFYDYDNYRPAAHGKSMFESIAIAANSGSLIIEGAKVTAFGGNIKAGSGYAEPWTEGVYCDDRLLIDGGELVAKAGNIPRGTSIGVEVGNGIEVESGILKAEGGAYDAALKVEPQMRGVNTNNGDCIIMGVATVQLGIDVETEEVDEGYEGPIIVVGKDVTTVDLIGALASNLPIRNEITGLGWADKDEAEDSEAIAVNEDGMFYDYERVRFHTHKFTYTADGDTITAKCADDDCDIQTGLELTISAPENTDYDGQPKEATLNDDYNTTAFPGEYTIVYKQDGAEVSEVVAAGDYSAEVTVEDATAIVEFTIEKAPFEVEAPSGLTAVYGQTLADVELPEVSDGEWIWDDDSTDVGDVGTKAFPAIFNPDDGNYASVTVDVDVTVTSAEVSIVADNNEKVYGEEDPELTATVDGLIGKDQVEYTVEREEGEDAGTYEIVVKAEADQGNYTVSVTNGEFIIKKAPAPELTDDMKPKPKDLTENGEDQTLLDPPKILPNGYEEIKYSDDGGKTWSDTIPTGKDAGEYIVDVQYVGDKNHETFNGEPITVKIKALFTVVWLDSEGTEIDRQTYTEGEEEPTTDKVPAKAEDENFTYEFSGWDEGVKSGNTTTYKPVFTAKAKSAYTVIWLNGDGTELDSKNYYEGEEEPTTDKIPTKAEDENVYTFAEWELASEEGLTKTYKPLFVAVPKELYYFVEGGVFEWKKGSNNSIVITVKRAIDDETCFGHFTGVKIGDVIFVSGQDFDAVSGSTVVTLKAAALDKLNVGEYPISIIFDDGEATATMKILAADEEPSVKTGDTGKMILWIVLALASAGALAGIIVVRRRKSEDR